LTGLVSLLALVCVGASFSHLTLSTRGERIVDAEMAADSVANLAAARLLQQATFGTTGPAAQRSLEITLPQGSARVSFDAQQALDWQIPQSRNNLASETSLAGFQRNIPPQSVQIIAEGRSGGVRRLIEVIVNQPPYKWAVASTGNIHSTGGLQVMGVKDLGMLANGIDQLPPDQILPGHVASDSADSQALQLDSSAAAPSLITGDAQACGSVALGPSTVVNGQVKPNSDPAKLPEFVVQRYDPEGIQGLQVVPQSSVSSAFQVAGLWRRSGDFSVRRGGLELNQGYLYVDGDLEVYGGLSGKGAIFATGNVTVHGCSEFQADSLQAIMAGGDVSLEGSDADSSSFQGLIMGGGDLHARHMSLVGSFLGTSREPGGSNVNLDQVKMVSNPQAISLDFPELFARQTNAITMATGLSSSTTVPGGPLAPGPAPLGQGQTLSTVQSIPAPNLTAERFYDPVRDVLDPNLVTIDNMPIHYRFNDGYIAKTYAEMREYTRRRLVVSENGEFLMHFQGSDEHLRESMREGVVIANQVYQRARQRGLERGRFSLDPNQFIQTSDKMRRMLWRVIE